MALVSWVLSFSQNILVLNLGNLGVFFRFLLTYPNLSHYLLQCITISCILMNWGTWHQQSVLLHSCSKSLLIMAFWWLLFSTVLFHLGKTPQHLLLQSNLNSQKLYISQNHPYTLTCAANHPPNINFLSHFVYTFWPKIWHIFIEEHQMNNSYWRNRLTALWDLTTVTGIIQESCIF